MSARKPIVVGYDGSDCARRALVRAAAVAGAGGAIVVVTVAEPERGPAVGGPAITATPPGEPAALLREAERLLAESGCEVSTRVEEGDAVEALIRAARDLDAELLVVGARGRDFVARALLGSVAARLVERAPCDVLVAR